MDNKNQIIGYVFLALGIALLVTTFALAMYAFISPEFIEEFQELVPPANGEEIIEAVEQIMYILIFVIAAILLWVMGSIGGKITLYSLKLIRTPDFSKKKSSSSSKKEKSKSSNVQRRSTRSQNSNRSQQAPQSQRPPQPPQSSQVTNENSQEKDPSQ